MTRAFRLFYALPLAFMAACSGQSNMVAPTAPVSGGAATQSTAGADLNRQIAQVRAATAAYHDLDKAIADGFVPLSPCVELPGVGGMGFHYGKPSRIDNGVNHLEPEILLYAPQGGKLHLVAVEYVVPLPLRDTAPSLFGRDYERNEALGLWALHAWIWKNNPAGMFEDFNPKVSCAN